MRCNLTAGGSGASCRHEDARARYKVTCVGGSWETYYYKCQSPILYTAFPSAPPVCNRAVPLCEVPVGKAPYRCKAMTVCLESSQKDYRKKEEDKKNERGT